MLTSRIIPQVSKQIVKRNFSYHMGSAISGPPSVRVSFAEKAGLGMLMFGSFLAYPAWVLIHMDAYKNHD